jgi:hypothetical protein
VIREPAIAAAIARAVAASRPRRVPLQDLLVAAASVDRTAAAAVGWRARILVAITALADEGAIELPRTRMDRTAQPPLPAYVTRPAAERPQRQSHSSVVWHADLAWAAELDDRGTLSPAERRFLVVVNTWLPRRRGIRVPLRERSLDLFGDEKVLEKWVLGSLFAPRRLTFELLETYPCWPPVEQTRLGSGAWLLVENYTTYRSISDRAEQLDFDGRIVWGSGNQVGTRLSALVATTPPPGRCWYFGDIDAGGVRAARLAVTRAAELGLPPLAPARGCYRLALHHGTARQSGRTPPAADAVTWARAWFGGVLGDDAVDVLVAKQRIVQEYVGVEVLAGTVLADWFDGQ